MPANVLMNTARNDRGHVGRDTGDMGCTVSHRGVCCWTESDSKRWSHWWVSAQAGLPTGGLALCCTWEFPSVCSFEGVWFQPVCLFWALANDGTEHKVWSAAEVPPLSSSLCSRSHSSQSTPSLLISACAFSYRKKPPVHWNPLPSWIRATVGLLLKQGLLTLNWYKAYESNKTCFAIEAEREAFMLSLSEFRWLQSISLSYKYTETQAQENSDVQL